MLLLLLLELLTLVVIIVEAEAEAVAACVKEKKRSRSWSTSLEFVTTAAQTVLRVGVSTLAWTIDCSKDPRWAGVSMVSQLSGILCNTR